ncbi:MAG: hypothetical protein ABIW84_10655, partial [Ilumatobacteraceae bacterium]
MPFFSIAQINPLFVETTEKQADSLKILLAQTTNDTLRMEAYRDLALHYLDINSDSASYYILQELPLVEKLNLKIWKADAYDLYSVILNNKGNYSGSLQKVTQALQIAENPECEKNIWHISKFTTTKNPRKARLSMLAAIQLDLGGLYRTTQDYDKQLVIHGEALKTAMLINDLTIITIVDLNLGELYHEKDRPDSARYFYEQSITNSAKCGYRKYLSGCYNGLAEISLHENQYSKVRQYLDSALAISTELRNIKEISYYYKTMSVFLMQIGKLDSALLYGYHSLAISFTVRQPKYTFLAYETIAKTYSLQKKYDSAFKYLQLADFIKDSLNSSDKIKQFQNVGFGQQLKLQELEKEATNQKNKTRTIALLTGLAFILLTSLILYRNNRGKQKANKILQHTLTDLNATQAQLIQAEKMASLGELTAGIAHEIQNPLNFVNNFSEVNTELLQELKNELRADNKQEAFSLADDIIKNEQKINHHGHRADAIVKGMLQH